MARMSATQGERTFRIVVLKPRWFAISALPPSPDMAEIADHEEHIHQPKCEPRGRNGEKPDREEDHARSQEEQHAPDQPEAIALTGMMSPSGVVDPGAERRAVVIEGGKRERECRPTHHNQRGLKRPGVNVAADEPRIEEEHLEREDRDT